MKKGAALLLAKVADVLTFHFQEEENDNTC